MGSSIFGDLADNIRPPRKDATAVVTVSTTARSYSMEACKFGRELTPDASTPNGDLVYLRVKAITADVWVQFDSTKTVTLSKTYAQTEASAEGEALTLSSHAGAKIAAGSFEDFALDRSRDKFIHVQGSAAGTVEIRAASEPFKK